MQQEVGSAGFVILTFDCSHQIAPPQSGLISRRVLYLILHFDVILNVGTGGDGGHVARWELLQLLGLKGIGASLSSDGLCPFRPHSPNRDLPQYGGVMLYHKSYSIITLFTFHCRIPF